MNQSEQIIAELALEMEPSEDQRLHVDVEGDQILTFKIRDNISLSPFGLLSRSDADAVKRIARDVRAYELDVYLAKSSRDLTQEGLEIIQQ